MVPAGWIFPPGFFYAKARVRKYPGRKDWNNMEKMVFEMINFLQDWGLWKDVSIFVGGKRYYDKCGSAYQCLDDVACEEDINQEDCMKGPVETGDGKMGWSSCANPEHIFDMTYEGPLQMLLAYDEYVPDRKKLSEECRRYILENTDIIEEYIYDNYAVLSPEGLAQQMWEDIFDNSELCYWDPLEFDTWEEYQELFGAGCGAGGMAVMKFDTYREFCEALDGGIEYFKFHYSDELKRRWEQITEEAQLAFLQENTALPENIRDHVYEAFAAIFEKYGLWHDYCFSWSLTTFRL